MLADTIAILVGVSSLYLLSTAFIAADSHRKDDFLWGAVGLFYALALWLSADRVTGALLLGQTAASALILAFGWQTLKLRQALLYPDRPVLLFSAVDWLGSRLGKVAPLKSAKAPATRAPEPPIEKAAEPIPETVAETGESSGDETGETLIADDFDEEFGEDLEFDDNVTEAWDRGITRDDDLTEPMIRRVTSIEEIEPASPSEEVVVTSLTEITAILEENSPPAPETPSETVNYPDPTENFPDQS